MSFILTGWQQWTGSAPPVVHVPATKHEQRNQKTTISSPTVRTTVLLHTAFTAFNLPRFAFCESLAKVASCHSSYAKFLGPEAGQA